jgi:CRISPR-associated protein Csm1
MSLQVFLQAQLLGIEDFLSAPGSSVQMPFSEFLGRCTWTSLLCEVLPRALLAELKLSRLLLGSSTAEQFFIVLPEEAVGPANEFLAIAAREISNISHHALRLLWVTTEELGAWPVARKRLDDAMDRAVGTPLAAPSFHPAALFAPISEEPADDAGFFAEFGTMLPGARTIAWSREQRGFLRWNDGDHSWPLRDDIAEGELSGEDAVLFPRRLALNDAGQPAELSELAERADGARSWAILRGDIDQFDVRLRQAASIEDHLQLSFLFKNFFAGELGLLCTLPEFWRKVTLVYRGGDDFVVAGSWDAVLALAREIQRVLERFLEQNVGQAVGIEAKTLSMALEISDGDNSSPEDVFSHAGFALREVKTLEAGSFHLFGRILDWKRLPDAEELQESLVRMVRQYRFSNSFLNDLASVYRESFAMRSSKRGKGARVEKPWRTYMQVSQVVPTGRSKELLNVRNSIITQLLGKRVVGLKLRPSARVGLDWARWAAGN